MLRAGTTIVQIFRMRSRHELIVGPFGTCADFSLTRRLIRYARFCVLVGVLACDRAKPSGTIDHASVKVGSVSKGTVVQKQQPNRIAATNDDPAVVKSAPAPEPQNQKILRPEDLRPKHDDARLVEAGIRIFESKRLKLYTDIETTRAKDLPELIDRLYIEWEAYLGPLPPDRAETEFQISGYLMRDMALFREFGLMPQEILIEHGRHRRNEFWMRDQSFDYYLRHLLIHEATHCFMTYMPDVNVPVWYLEGMAEYFGAHQINGAKRPSFRVMPNRPNEFAGFGRIITIQEDIAANKRQSIEAIFAFRPVDFLTTHHYGWSWALCAFLDGNPRYHERFQKLSRSTQGTQFQRMFVELFGSDLRELNTEWVLFASNLQYGYDLERSAINFEAGAPLSDDQPETSRQIDAGRGWQSSGVRLEQGSSYEISATGRFSLGEQPKPWISEPQGITFRYFNATPLGMLVGCLRTDEGFAGEFEESMLRVVTLGAIREFNPPVSGTLYLRLNDAWNSLDDNRGHATVTIRKHSDRVVGP